MCRCLIAIGSWANWVKKNRFLCDVNGRNEDVCARRALTFLPSGFCSLQKSEHYFFYEKLINSCGIWFNMSWSVCEKFMFVMEEVWFDWDSFCFVCHNVCWKSATTCWLLRDNKDYVGLQVYTWFSKFYLAKIMSWVACGIFNEVWRCTILFCRFEHVLSGTSNRIYLTKIKMHESLYRSTSNSWYKVKINCQTNEWWK